MAKRNNEKPTMRKSVGNTMKRMREILDDIYQDTYSSNKMNDNDLEDVTDTLSKSIDTIISRSFGDSSVSNITKVMNRFNAPSYDNINSVLKDALDVMENDGASSALFNLYSNNLWIGELDREIDMVLKYMPRLKEALDCLKDCVLSADHFSKEYISLKTNNIDDNIDLFNRKSEALKTKYKIQEFFEKCYDDMSKYGEAFVYIVPYRQEIAKLLNNKARHNIGQNARLTESYILEGADESILSSINTVCKENNMIADDLNIKVSFQSGYVQSAYNNAEKIHKILEYNISKPFTEQFSDIITESKEEKIKLDDKMIPDELHIPKDIEDPYKSSATDGLINREEIKPEQIKAPGCILKKLPRSNLLISKIDTMVLGYYYIEILTNQSVSVNNGTRMYNYSEHQSMSSYMKNKSVSDEKTRNEMDKIISYISGRMSQMIDKNFVNANQDLSQEIYTILKHNDLYNDPVNLAKSDIRVTFIPADDIVHMYFKKDDETGRGISDLNLSLFPAKLYISLYINDAINNIARGQDKRVYYVKQNVETNISATLINVLNQIKKGNFGVRNFDNLSSMFNIIGRFNDYVIPVNGSNDPPIQFEIMPGMKSDLDQDLMDRLEKMAINPTDVTIDVIESRQSLDFAIQATMVNSKLMRKSYNRQNKLQGFCSQIMTKLYMYEYDQSVDIQVQLPAPAFLNMTNSSNLFSTTEQYVESLTNMYLYDSSEEEKQEFKRLAMEYYIGSQLDTTVIESFRKRAKLLTLAKKQDEDNNQ